MKTKTIFEIVAVLAGALIVWYFWSQTQVQTGTGGSSIGVTGFPPETPDWETGLVAGGSAGM